MKPSPNTLPTDAMGRRLIMCLAGLLGTLQGCVVVPTPEHSPTVWDDASDNGRRNVSRESTQRIVPGQTRIEDVLLSLGEPDAVAADGRRIAYRWDKVKALVVGPTGVGTLTKEYYLVVNIDEKG